MSFHSFSIARFRIATLWSFEPVKYIIAAPYSSSSKIRTSTWVPIFNLTLTRLGPLSSTCSSFGYFASTSPAVLLVESRSRSPIVLFPRLRLPAMLTEIFWASKYDASSW